MTRHDIGEPSTFPEGEGIGVVVDGLPLAVFRVDGELYAVQNRCPHKGGPMHDGDVDASSCSVQCPWHAWEWNLETGEFVVDDRKRLRTFDVTVDGGRVLVEI